MTDEPKETERHRLARCTPFVAICMLAAGYIAGSTRPHPVSTQKLLVNHFRSAYGDRYAKIKVSASEPCIETVTGHPATEIARFENKTYWPASQETTTNRYVAYINRGRVVEMYHDSDRFYQTINATHFSGASR